MPRQFVFFTHRRHMKLDSPCRILANAIQEKLCGTICVNANTMHYMMSVSGIESIAELRKTLRDETSSESATLMELLVFPDEAFQVYIENHIEIANPGKADEKTISSLLMHQKIESTLQLPGLGNIPAVIPPEAVQSVISRLNLSWKTDHRVLDALNRFSEEPLRTRCKVRLRNAKWIQNEPQIHLLQNVIRKMAPQKDFQVILDILLDFLTVLHPEDLQQALESEKERLIHLLDLADRQDHFLRTSPMETLMLQGFRRVSVDRDEVINRIRIFDKICRSSCHE
jgi:hypothetical protein